MFMTFVSVKVGTEISFLTQIQICHNFKSKFSVRGKKVSLPSLFLLHLKAISGSKEINNFFIVLMPFA